MRSLFVPGPCEPRSSRNAAGADTDEYTAPEHVELDLVRLFPRRARFEFTFVGGLAAVTLGGRLVALAFVGRHHEEATISWCRPWKAAVNCPP